MRILRRITACEAFMDQEETVEKRKEARRVKLCTGGHKESLGYLGTIFMAVRDRAPASRFPRGK